MKVFSRIESLAAMRIVPRLPLAAAAICILTAATPLAAIDATDTALGSQGELYRVLEATYGELFPNGLEASPENPALALEITWPDQGAERLLIPGTEDAAAEKAPSLSLDRASDTLFVTWESTRTIHSELFIASYESESWSEVLEFSGSPFTQKANPRLAATRERYLTHTLDGEVEERSQSILHLTWWDRQGSLDRVLWAPLIAEAEGLVPISPIDLRDFIDVDLAPADAPPSGDFAQRPFIQTGSDQGHVLLAYVDPESSQIVTFSARLSGGSIDTIADEARAQVIIIGLETQDRVELADRLKVDLGALAAETVDSSVASYLADEAAQAVLSADPGSTIQSIAEEARAQVIIIGARLRGAMTNATDPARAQVIIIGANHPGLEHGRSLAITLLNHRPTPVMPDSSEANIMVSPDGLSMIVAWRDGDYLRYVESEGDGWTDQRSLLLGGDLTAQTARAILERRLGS